MKSQAIDLRLLASSLAMLASVVMADDFYRVTIGGMEFEVADGYKLTKIATDELVQRPTVACWDDQRRLVVCESAGTHESTKDQLRSKPHRLVRLTDRDGDGVFDERLVAATDLSFYSGVLCIGNNAYVSTPPNILKLTDDDGDGVYEDREVWHDGGTITGCANDLHGPYLGRDGWIYWCKGAFAEQTHVLTSGKKLVSTAAHLLRRRPNGGPVDVVMSGGMDNPVEMVFLPNGEKLFTSTFLQHPTNGRRDGIAHAVYGSLFGKIHRVIDSHWRTGEVMPVMTHLGPAAPSGLAYLNQWSGDAPSIACAQFNLHKISLHQLIPRGATFRTEDRDLVRSEHLVFHPTDVVEDEDGSLIICDTGDWYDLCCPSSGPEGSKDVGGIYRLRKVDQVTDTTDKTADVSSLSADAFLGLLDDPSHVIRRRAADLMVSANDLSVAIRKKVDRSDLSQRMAIEIVWLLAREPSDESRLILEEILGKGLRSDVQTAALNALSLIGPTSLDSIKRCLADSADALVRRAAAECLGRHGDASCVSLLMDALESARGDRTLEHSIIYALLELDEPKTLTTHLVKELVNTTPEQVRASLLVLRQTNPELLSPMFVLEATESTSERLRDTAFETLQKNPTWAGELASEIQTRWSKSESKKRSLIRVIAAWHENEAFTDWLPGALKTSKVTDSVDLLEEIGQRPIPTIWDHAILSMLQQSDSSERQRLLGLLAKSRLSNEHSATLKWLVRNVGNSDLTISDRLRVAAAIPKSIEPPSHGASTFVADVLIVGGEPERDLATATLDSLQLDQQNAARLLDHLDRTQVVHLLPVLRAISRSSPANAERLLDRIIGLPSARTLGQDAIVELFADGNATLKQRASQIAKQLLQPTADIATKLSKLEKELPPGDAVRGMHAFRSKQAACAVCHKIGYVGGDIGPVLTGIGRTRSRRDLLEAIVFPSSHVAQGYQSTKLLTADGRIVTGIVKFENDDKVELHVGIGKEVVIAKEKIEQRIVSKISLMPSGLDGVLTKQQLADVLQLLKPL